MIVPARRLRLVWWGLVWERLWPALWPAVAIVLGFAVLAVFDLLPMLPGWLHALVLAGFAVALLAGLADAARRFRLPDSGAAARRLERDNGLAHRPLAALGDRLAVAAGDPLALALWQAHRRRMAAASASLRPAWPRAGLVERDPYGLRVLLILLIGIGVVAAEGDAGRRLASALRPTFAPAPTAALVGYDLWITPPDYTGLPPVYRGTAVAGPRDEPADQPIPVPVGSTLLARVHGGSAVPDLTLDGKATRFETLAGGEFTLAAPLTAAATLALRQGGDILARFALRTVPDLPPSAGWTAPGQPMQRGTLKLDYEAKDDYGVTGLTLEVKRATGDEPPVTIALPAPAQEREIKASLYQDLTASPWAGLPVELTLIARDALGQLGRSASQVLKLPERVFLNPVAKAVVEQRTLLRRDPAQADIVAETLADLSLQTGLYHEDASVFLGLRAAARRLALDRTIGADPATQELLWDIAVRIEDGDVPEAQKTLRQAEQALQDAIDRNASDAELEKLMAQLDQAISRYLQSLAAEAAKSPPAQGGTGDSISAEDIHKLLDQARRLAQTGARDSARQALNNLQNLLESLRAGQSQAGRTGSGGQALQDLARQQMQLMDRSYSAARQGRGDQPDGQAGEGRQGQAGRKPGESPGDLAGAQEQLRRQLGEMMQQMGDAGEGPPQAFGRAERAMRGAAEALRRGDPGSAVGAEGEALDQLQQGAREMAERAGQGQGGRQAGGTDPFGRNGMGSIDNGDVKLPAAIDLQRSRAILDELRRRAGQPDRPRLERDYLNRLLQRF